MDYQTILDTANAIKEKLDNFTPKVAIVLGSGFGEVIDSIENKVEISYKDVPNMPVSTVAGHKGSFIFGNIENTKVAVMNGRLMFVVVAEESSFFAFSAASFNL